MPHTARQETILTWLRKAYPGAADLFISGLRVREDVDMPCRTRLMAHAFRELCIVINNQHSKNARKVDPIPAMVKEYAALNYKPTPLGPSAANAPPSPQGDLIQVPDRFMRSVSEVAEAHNSRESQRDRVRKTFQAISSASGVQADVTSTADRWYEMYNYFVGRAHAHDADSGGTDPEKLEGELHFFEITLESLAQPAIPNLNELDVLLAEANA